MGFFRNQTFALAAADSARPIDYSILARAAALRINLNLDGAPIHNKQQP
jgi:hypothetical protein